MSPRSEDAFQTSPVGWLRARIATRGAGFVLALAIEVLLVLVLLTLGRAASQKEKPPVAMVSVNFEADNKKDEAPKVKEPEQAAKPRHRTASRAEQQDQPQPKPTEEPATAPTPPPFLMNMSRDQLASANIASLPHAPSAPSPKKSTMGPSDSGVPGDTPRVSGSGPHGEPLYAASWYREPYHDELSGYLSTARGPGWGLIACKTAPNYRVTDCVELDEWPQGSGIAHAVAAAAWQFLVRPPRVGGVPQVGDWVRIRIDYGIKKQAMPG
ncbi:hypothetical protein RXV95_12160 [Novosphingobium sp. ZN18A2]|uniref:hypothetical protein n=1 Tax=Novosphingobium sp. ZN18A2 TaxID=3079861 RepID=UPI0030CEF604